jgi:hypothetical protein
VGQRQCLQRGHIRRRQTREVIGAKYATMANPTTAGTRVAAEITEIGGALQSTLGGRFDHA